MTTPPFTHLRLRTEHSYQTAAGKIDTVLDCLESPFAAITDRHGTWGHAKWAKACKEKGKVPVFGVELACVTDMEVKEKQPINYVVLLARNAAGLRAVYDATSLATEKFYYVPRIDYNFLRRIAGDDLIILSGANPLWDHIRKGIKNFYVELNPLSAPDTIERAKAFGYGLVATGDNIYPRPEDQQVYDVIMGEARVSRTVPGHIINRWDFLRYWPGQEKAIANSLRIAATCEAQLPKAKLVHPKVKKTLRQLCQDGAMKRPHIALKGNKVYADRMDRELKLIGEKKFEDYFFVVADMINWAKERMFVGPARGSSCGSLVCYLLGITDIDPIPFGLLFERFIDANREDYPDIDIDFPDDRRELVFEYLRAKYGSTNVARLGTVNVFKPKSALGICAKELLIPEWEINDLKNAIVERSSGDARATFCILDTFQQLEIGRSTLSKYPELAIAGEIEGHASHTGMHSAGILITADPVVNYCSINHRTGTAMIDKKDAEKLEMLKIDALGLRTLSILQDCLDQIGWTKEQLRDYRLDDAAAFQILNDSKYSGIFQFEGYALQSLVKQFNIDRIEDVISITALARPGPMNSGGASEYVQRRGGKAEVTYMHPLTKGITEVTFGVIVYQEQVMQIAREIGELSWMEVSELRRTMSNSKGEEYFNRFWEAFLKGAQKKMDAEMARKIWDNINTMGSWAFNRSHAVAYGMISYWCCLLKAHYPLQFAAACLRNAKDDDQSIKILRELVIEGFKYKPFDKDKSIHNWSVQDGQLVGGLTAIKGIGDKLAAAILRKRETGQAYSPREVKLLTEGETPWDKVFECADRWAHIFREPAKYNISSPLCHLSEITAESDGTFCFIAKLKSKVPRDHNELLSVQKRNGKRMTGPTAYLNLILEDDTSAILANINRFRYESLAVPIIEQGKIGQWYLWRGQNKGGFRRVYIERLKKLTGNQEFMPTEKNLKKGVDQSPKINETDAAPESGTKPKNKKTKTTNDRTNHKR